MSSDLRRTPSSERGGKEGVLVSTPSRLAANEIVDAGVPTELRKKLGTSSVVAIGYLTVTTWTAYSTASATALVSGGLNVFFWGLLISVACNLCGAASLAEAASLYPHGNQAVRCYMLASKKIRRPLSYANHWWFLLGYCLLCLAVCVILAQLTLAMAQITHPDYVIQPFHVPLVMNAYAIYGLLFSFYGSKIIAKANNFSLIWNVSGFVLVSIFILVQSRGRYNTPSEAFVTVVNESGWPNSFVPWVSGLSQAALSTTAYDAVAHWSSEMYKPERDVPLAMMSAIGLNGFFGLLYAVIFVFCLPPNAIELLSSPTGFPFGQFLLDLTGQNKTGAVFLLLIFLVSFLLTLADLVMATSRITCTFARQGGLPKLMTRVNRRLDAPVNAAISIVSVVMGISWIYVGSTAGFLAFVSAPAVVLTWTYSTVAASMLLHGRSHMTVRPRFRLRGALGPIANCVIIVFSACITVFLCLPATYPVTAASMNYTAVLLAASLIAPTFGWFLYAKDRYHGPVDVSSEHPEQSSPL
jgi:amino acid transporter